MGIMHTLLPAITKPKFGIEDLILLTYEIDPLRGVSELGAGTFNRADTPTYVNDTTGLVTTIAVNKTRFENPDDNQLLALLEPTSKNWVTYSHEFRAAISDWINLRSTVTDDAVVGPDGTSAADKLVMDGTNAATHPTYVTIVKESFTNDTSVTFSAYIKQADFTWAALRIDTKANSSRFGYFNLATGAVGFTSSDSSGIEVAANGFYRVWITTDIENGVTDPLFYVYMAEADGDITFATGDGTSGIYAWGAQVEESTHPTSLIPTSGATATRTTESGMPYYTVPTGIYAEALGAELVTDGAFANVSLAAAKGVSGITKAAPGVITFDSGHGYVNGDIIFFSGLTEMTELNTEYWKLRSNVGDTFELSNAAIGTWDTSSLDTSGYGAAETTGGNVAQATSFTDWIEGDGWHPGVDGAGALTNTADIDGEQGALSIIWEAIGISANATYKCLYTLSNRVASNFFQVLGSSESGAITSADASVVEYLTADATPNGNYIITATSGLSIGSIDNVSVKQVTNAYNSNPPESTTVMLWRPGFAEADAAADYGILSVQDAVASLLYGDVSGNGIAAHDGTSEAVDALAYAANTTYKLALQIAVNSNVYQFRVGQSVLGGSISWGSWVDYDGAFITGGNGLQFANGMFGRMHVGHLGIWKRVVTDAEINAW